MPAYIHVMPKLGGCSIMSSEDSSCIGSSIIYVCECLEDARILGSYLRARRDHYPNRIPPDASHTKSLLLEASMWKAQIVRKRMAYDDKVTAKNASHNEGVIKQIGGATRSP